MSDCDRELTGTDKFMYPWKPRDESHFVVGEYWVNVIGVDPARHVSTSLRDKERMKIKQQEEKITHKMFHPSTSTNSNSHLILPKPHRSLSTNHQLPPLALHRAQ